MLARDRQLAVGALGQARGAPRPHALLGRAALLDRRSVPAVVTAGLDATPAERGGQQDRADSG